MYTLNFMNGHLTINFYFLSSIFNLIIIDHWLLIFFFIFDILVKYSFNKS